MESNANVQVTKQAAAVRQLKAAIRMFLSQEDELAIHTVASASYRVLSDLKAERGKDEVADSYRQAILHAVRSYRAGTLSQEVHADADAMRWIKDISDRVAHLDDVSLDLLKVSADPRAVRKYWNDQNRISNFLKHADRDARSSIPAADVNNFLLLLKAGTACEDLLPGNLGNEGLAFLIYVCAAKRDVSGLPDGLREMVEGLAQQGDPDRRKLCLGIARGPLHQVNSDDDD